MLGSDKIDPDLEPLTSHLKKKNYHQCDFLPPSPPSIPMEYQIEMHLFTFEEYYETYIANFE